MVDATPVSRRQDLGLTRPRAGRRTRGQRTPATRKEDRVRSERVRSERVRSDRVDVEVMTWLHYSSIQRWATETTPDAAT